MAATNAAVTGTTTVESSAVSSDELAAKVAHKRFEGLVMVRTKAVKGKGAWYWAHLEPILVHNSDTGLPKAVKLRCSLCDAVFSASNPSRTASEHLKRGTCPNFASATAAPATAPNPISSSSPSPSVATASASPPPPHNHRKRTSGSRGGVATAAAAAAAGIASHYVPPLTIVDPSKFTVDLSYPPLTAGGGTAAASASHQQLVLSGGREDLGALAMLEDSVKRLKSPKSWPGPALTKAQADSALDLLADWVYDCCGSVSLSSLDHPKFKAFLTQVGLPNASRRDLTGARLDAKYAEAKADSEAKIRDAMFFQIAADGWRPTDGEDTSLVHLGVNLPNGTHVFRRAVFTTAAHSDQAEQILWETILDLCGGAAAAHHCVGIVSDKFKSKALKNLEDRHNWMVNISCQHHAFTALIMDFSRDLPLFKTTSKNCLTIASFINSNSQIRHTFHKHHLHEYGHPGLLRATSDFTVIDDVLTSAAALHLVFSDEPYKIMLMDSPAAREIEEIRRNPHFWNEVEAVHSLIKLIKTITMDVEIDKPRVGQCLPLWEELRVKVKEWCSRFQLAAAPVERIVEKRFKKNYHPSWAAAFILDPLYLIRDATGKYLPPFKCLTGEQEKDVDKLITRLVSREEAHIALMELMKWRTQGLDPVYAQAVQLKQRDPGSGKMRIANPQSSRLVWETYLSEFKSLGKVAVRLIFLHATSSCGGRQRRFCPQPRPQTRAGVERLQKMIFIAAHSKTERREGSNSSSSNGGEDELFALENGEDDVLNEVFVDTSSVSV